MISSDAFIIRYLHAAGPGKEGEYGAILEVNCQAWAHRRLPDFGVWIPPWMLSLELYEDEERFVQTVERPYRAGDIFLFGPTGLLDMRKLHWALFTGVLHGQSGEPLLEHVNIIDQGIGIWPLGQFQEVPRYAKLFAVKRFIQPLTSFS